LLWNHSALVQNVVAAAGSIYEPNGAALATLVLQPGEVVRVVSDASLWFIVGRYQPQQGIWPVGTLTGLTLSVASTTSVGIAVGTCRNEDAGQPYNMTLGAAITKTFSNWAVGSGNGGLDTGTIAANTWYYIHLIRKDADGTLDAVISLSATAPTMPAGYTARRRIGAIRTNASSQVTAFIQVGDHFMLDAPVADATSTVSSSAAQLVTLSVPPISGIEADFEFSADSSSFGFVLVSSPLTSDLAPSSTVAPYFTVIAASTNSRGYARLRIPINASGQIRHRNTSSSNTTITIVTHGWYDSRGRV
jgi:hypothetical protein